MAMLFQQNKKYLYKVKTIQNVRQCLETPALLLIHYSCWKIKESPRIGYNVTVPKTSSTENCGICLHEMNDAATRVQPTEMYYNQRLKPMHLIQFPSYTLWEMSV